MTRRVINVTQAHIDNGIPGDPTCCPIALAVEYRFGAAPEFVGAASGIELDSGERYRIPAKARQFIRDFDNGLPVAPFRFTIEVPE